MSTHADDRFLNSTELSELLRVTVWWIRAATERNGVPFVQLSSQRKYRFSDVQEWLESRRATVDGPAILPRDQWPSEDEQFDLLDVKEAAKFLRVTQQTFQALLQNRSLPFVLVPARRRFRKCDLRKWLDEQVTSIQLQRAESQ